MPKKKPVKLPEVYGATPRGHGDSRIPLPLASLGESSPTRNFAQSVSHDYARKLAEGLDSSFEIPPGLGKGGTQDSDWEVQSPEDILREVRQRVQDMKPWREELNDSLLEKRRQSDRQAQADRGYLIILPDNRVRAMEDQLSSRVRAQLLGETGAPGPTQASPRPPEEAKPKGPRRSRNPWYLPSKSWYKQQRDKDEDEGEGFPYDSKQRGTGKDAPTFSECEKGDGDRPAGPISQKDKDTLQIIEEYRQYMKHEKAGQRLPHFLQ
mmetsp:Transcript_63376/g.163051  ORF Transcript_63376/g.163051 Transcript_63376/m.163051 type:complete len:266 (+) Transcript_63376:80-877(+)